MPASLASPAASDVLRAVAKYQSLVPGLYSAHQPSGISFNSGGSTPVHLRRVRPSAVTSAISFTVLEAVNKPFIPFSAPPKPGIAVASNRVEKFCKYLSDVDRFIN